MPRTMSLARFSFSCSAGNCPSIASRILAAPTPTLHQLPKRQLSSFAIAASPSFVQRQVRKSSNMSFQAPHPTLLIPGPIEFDDEVLRSMSHYRYVIELAIHWIAEAAGSYAAQPNKQPLDSDDCAFFFPLFSAWIYCAMMS